MPTAARDQVAVTGLGLVTPAGIGTVASWQGILSGRPTATSDERLTGLPVNFSCRVPDFDPGGLLGRRIAWRLDRYSQLALLAAREAVADAGLDPTTWDGARVGVVIGNALGGTATYERQQQILHAEGVDQVSPLLIPMMGISMVAGYIAIDVRASGPNLVTVTACASGATAIGTALLLLRAGACDVVLAGGTESSLTPTIIAGFTQAGALSRRSATPALASRPFDSDRDGFVAAEGAAVLILERLGDARARRANVRALLRGYGASADAHHATAPDPDGMGIARAVRAALVDADVDAGAVDHVNAHGTSTPLNDIGEARVLARMFAHRPAVTSIKGVIGHSLGAAGAIEAACTVLTIQAALVPPTANLQNQDPRIDLDVVTGKPRPVPVRTAISNSFGFGGQNAVLVLSALD